MEGGAVDVEGGDVPFKVAARVSESEDSLTKSQSSPLRCFADTCVLSK